MERLANIGLFVEVVKAKGFRRAAEVLGIPNSTLSRKIAELEQDIGLRLLHRTTRKIELTEAGRNYFERCKNIMADVQSAHEQLADMSQRPSGKLRVSLPTDFASNYLVPIIVNFANKYPEISFDFELTPRKADLVSEPLDMAIRIGHLPDSNLIARQVASLPMGLYASPDYLKRAGEPLHPKELSLHDCICMTAKANSHIWVLQRKQEKLEVRVGGRFTLNSVGMSCRLAALNMGIALLAEEVVRADLLAGNLKQILPEWKLAPSPVYVVTETRLLPAKVQCFIDYLTSRL
ncbi:LysR family transcriptional regulator [Entomomonas asaccharolytica]|uniref:LysR family transcriptional regulator n=1 Tax=Entomomonas asaccharolytica TaxID=2785331 RepID=A0A974NGH9_9GAMM|nr:LysR family transcriptional regulator [Entomomonas asaccharolytica]QQP86123.1 LysR family transcriptional regulator [Entomomonas asaccharolytica]